MVLRPVPGADRTIAALAAAGLTATALPLFAIRPTDWSPPPGAYDAVVLTSVQAVRHAGPQLAALGLPILAVGPATAAAATAAGLSVRATGEGGVAALLDVHARNYPRLLHAAGRERIDDPRLTPITVYAADALPVAAPMLVALGGAVVLVHSARAARRLDAVAAAYGIDRTRTRLATLGATVAAAAGAGWDMVAVADRPTDAAVIAVAVRLAD